MRILLRQIVARYVDRHHGGQALPARLWDSQAPIREELFGVERIEQHARSLAAAQPVTPHRLRGLPLAGRLAENATVLFACHRAIAQAAEAGSAITPAAEWLLDNYYLVERQIEDVRADLPAGYYRQLPKLAAGPFAGYPRIFGLAWSFVAHTDSQFSADVLDRYVRAYQEIQPLTLGELWALATTLRIVLIENLRRIAEATVRNRTARQQADLLADRLLSVGDATGEPSPRSLADYARAPLQDAFAVQLTHRLREQDPRAIPALTWLDERLAQQGTTRDTAVQHEHQRQGAATVTVRNIINSLRLISDVDWTETVERMSLVNDVLATSGDFPEMDFATRNLYRSAVETLARGSNRTELEVARAAVEAAAEEMEVHDRHADELEREGVMSRAFALEPTATATSVRGDLVTDGPFIEAKEVIVGFYIIDAPDLDGALRVARRNPILQRGGGLEVRPIAGERTV